MALFEAIYGDAFAVTERILQDAPLTLRQMRALLNMYLTPDGAMEIDEKLTDGSWPLMRKNKDGQMERALPEMQERPLTTLELQWLRSLCEDERAPLFLSDEQLKTLREALKDVPPIFRQDEIDNFDSSHRGDDFASPAYRQHFQTILFALREQKALRVRYTSFKGNAMFVRMIPQKLEYSAKDRRFRLHGQSGGRHVTLNLSRIWMVEADEATEEVPETPFPLCEEPLIVRVTDERNALARFMLEFSCFKKESEIDRETGVAVVKVWYPPQDEVEIVIRVLGFGAAVQVMGPESFARQVRERVRRQTVLTELYSN